MEDTTDQNDFAAHIAKMARMIAKDATDDCWESEWPEADEATRAKAEQAAFEAAEEVLLAMLGEVTEAAWESAHTAFGDEA